MESGVGSNWIIKLLQSDFSTLCGKHFPPAMECKFFCVDCSTDPVCHSCKEDHTRHNVLQIRQSSYCDAVRVNEISKSLDISGVQSYVINGARVVYLHSRPQKNCPAGIKNKCICCSRGLIDTSSFCSIQCKFIGYTDNGASEETYVKPLANGSKKICELSKISCPFMRSHPRKRAPHRSPLGCIVSDWDRF